jgi:predicted small lipoprotein YifL
MKKIVSLLLVLAMMLALAACGASKPAETEAPATEAPVVTEAPATEAPATEAPETEAPATEAPVADTTTLEGIVNAITTMNPVEFMGGMMPVDLTDTSEDGLWALKAFTGLDNADMITEVAVFEPMMGSIPYSMVLVRAADAANAEAVADAMKAGIDQRKWICVEADDLKVAGFGDVVMLIMVNSDSGMTAQSFVDAFATVAGFQPEFVM